MKSVKQLTEHEAIEMADTNWWLNKTDKEIVDFQLYQSRLCAPFDIFRVALENELGESLSDTAFTMPDLLRNKFEHKDLNTTLSYIEKTK